MQPKRCQQAIYTCFSSTGRMGGPTWRMTRFLKKIKTAARNQITHPDHRGRSRTGQEDRVDAPRSGAGQMATHYS